MKVGSPPPMRGKVVSIRRVCPEVGITPAYAGKSHDIEDLCRIEWDHPRLCGEK